MSFVCDITVHNANVFYELGVRHALRRKHTVLIKGEPSADKTPFDIGGFRYLGYPIANPARTVDALVGAIQSGLRGGRATDSPVFHFLPALPEAPSNAAVSPDFTSEVQRAVAARDKGWLLMLAEDLRQLRFERAGLHQVAFAQFDLQDFEPARRNLERLLQMGHSDVRLHFKLANIYERMYRRTGKAEHFERSQQAIQAALQRPDLSAPDHAEALSLRGRNLKTRWRMAFEKLSSLEERRRQACRRPLLDSHADYQAAFRRDLNSFYSGIACLQAGHLLRSLSSEPGWPSMFKTTREAKRYADELEEDLPHMAHVVAAAIAHGLEYGNANDRKWAAISEVDLHFLTEDDAAMWTDQSGLIAQYESALTGCEPFFRDAAIGQLELFARVGLRTDVAEAVVIALRRAAPPSTAAAVRPHLVVFAGHAIDAPTRSVPRFPAAAELRARELIRERLVALQAPPCAGGAGVGSARGRHPDARAVRRVGRARRLVPADAGQGRGGAVVRHVGQLARPLGRGGAATCRRCTCASRRPRTASLARSAEGGTLGARQPLDDPQRRGVGLRGAHAAGAVGQG